MIQLWQGIEVGQPALAQAGDQAARLGYNWASVLAFLVMGAVFVAVALGLGWLLRPHMPTAEKSSIYECGERPIGRAWFQFNPRFYIVALIFVVFEVEIAFMIPVATVYRGWAQGVTGTQAEQAGVVRARTEAEALTAGVRIDEAIAQGRAAETQQLAAARAQATDPDRPSPWVAFAELLIFVAILVVGLAYIWAKGDLEWVRRLKGVRDEAPRLASDLVREQLAAQQPAAAPLPAPEPARQSA